MTTRDPRIDAYIARAPDYARPILGYVRAAVTGASPKIEETLKWGRPHFLYKGLVCGVSAFKAHCAFGFWRGSLVVRPPSGRSAGGMGQFGRVTRVADLPSRAAIGKLVRAAMALNDAGVKSPTRAKRAPRPPARVPADLARGLKADAKARATFAALSPSGKREYVEWLADAKRAETRERRLATTLEWLAAGKSRNWQYETANRPKA
jgi:uncharacterized protein YdeI (YjbR/CyaY-like superfamily)